MADALKIEIDVSAAKTALDQLKQSFGGFQTAATTSVNGASTAVQRLNTEMSKLKGIDRAAIDSFGKLQQAMSGLNVGSLHGLAAELQRLAAVNMTNVAAQFRQLSVALGSLRVPSNLASFVGTLNALGTAAQRAGQQVAGAGLQIQGAANHVGSFGNALRPAQSILGAFGVALGAAGFAQFTKSAYDAARSTDSFLAAMQSITGSSQAAGEQLKYVDGIAAKLAIGFNEAREGFKNFAASALTAGMPLDAVKTTFEGVATAARVLNLSADDTMGVFRALSQIAGKGTVQMEELRGQLGDRIPGAIDAMARAVGVGTDQLFEMVKAGQVGADVLPRFGEELMKTFGGGLPAALSSTQAGFARLSQAFFTFTEQFGRGFFDGLKSTLGGLAEALNASEVQARIRAIGSALGELASGFGAAFVAAFDVIGRITEAIGNFVTNVGSAVSALNPFASAVQSAAGPTDNLLTGLKALGFILGGFVIVSSIAAGFTLLRSAFAAAAVGAQLFAAGLTAIMAASGPLKLVLGLVAAGAVVLASQFGLFEKANAAIASTLPQTQTSLENYSGSTDELKEKMAALSEKSGEFKSVQDQLAAGFQKVDEQAQPLPGSLGSLQATVSTLTEPFDSLRGSAALTANAFSELATSGPTVATAFATIGAAIAPLNEPFLGFVTSAERLNTTMGGLQASMPLTAQGFTTIAAALAQTTESLPSFVANTERLGAQAAPLDAVRVAFTGFLDALNESIPQIDSAASNMQTLATAGDGVRVGFDAATAAGGTFIDALDSVNSAIDGTISQMNALKAAAEAALRAAREAQNAGGDSTATGSGRYGGFAQALPERMTAPIDAFNNAPAFRDGTANTSRHLSKIAGGGIPSILHPNEAVVPLPKGRSIPVDLNLDGLPPVDVTASFDAAPLTKVASQIAELSRAVADNSSAVLTLDASGQSRVADYGGNSSSLQVSVPEPVFMPRDVVYAGTGGGAARASQRGDASAPPSIIIEKGAINVQAADVDSFNRSADQVARQLGARIRRAAARVG